MSHAGDILRDDGFLELDDYLDKFDVVSSESRFRVLYQLAHAHELSAGELADRLEMDKGTLRYHLEKLVDAGLIQNRRREERSAGENYSYYTATDAGQRILATVTGFIRHDQTPEEQMDPRTFASELILNERNATTTSQSGENVVAGSDKRRESGHHSVNRKHLAQQITASLQQKPSSGGI